MSRGLTANEIANLNLAAYRLEYLVEIYLANNNFFYTTGDYDVSVSTATSGGSQTFKSRSYIAQIGGIAETYMPSPSNLDLQFHRISVGGLDDAFTSASNLNADIINRRVVMYMLFRDKDTFAPDTSDGLIQMFDGKIGGMDVTTTEENITYTIRCTSAFGDYKRIRGKTTADIVGALRGETIQWGGLYFD